MTYYLSFILISDRDRSKIKGFSSYSNSFTWEYSKDTDTWFGLYAWTTDKKLMKKFKKQRSKELFRYKKMKCDELDVRDLDSSLELKEYQYKTNNKGYEETIVSTQFEYTTSTDEGMVVDIFMPDQYLDDPLLLSNGFLKLLENFGYSYMFYSYSSNALPFDEDDYEDSYRSNMDERLDLFWNNYAYKDIDDGTYLNEKSMKCRSVNINELNSFVNLFSDLFI